MKLWLTILLLHDWPRVHHLQTIVVLQREIHSRACESYDWLSCCSMINQECMMLVIFEAETRCWWPFMAYNRQHHRVNNLTKEMRASMRRNPLSSSILCVNHFGCMAWTPPSIPACSPPQRWTMAQASCDSPLATLRAKLAMSRHNTSALSIRQTPVGKNRLKFRYRDSNPGILRERQVC